MQQKVAALLPKLKLIISPQEALASYWRAARVLTFLLFAYSIPIIGLVLAFIALVGGLLAQQQQNEVAVLRSRGASALQIILIAALEGVILGVLALIIAIPVGQLITQLIGKTRSFLDFSLISDLRWGVSRDVLQVGLIAVGISLLAILIPTIGASRHTIVTYKQERARTLRAPWWQRAYMDIFLLIPAVYGMYQLRKQGSILAPGSDLVSSADPFQNPLLFLVPALGVLALTLFLLRFFPWFMAALAWISGRTRSVGFLLAARHLARSPGFYSAPVVLLVLTLSLSAFTASLASTLDKHLHDSTFYQAGSEMSLVEPGEDLSVGAGFNPGGGGEEQSEAPAETSELDEGTPRWLILPVKEHLLVPGIEAVMRMGRFAGFTQLSGRSQAVVFMGIDRVEFPKVAFWRRDFSDENLGTLMNALALEDGGVLVENSFLRQHGLKVGDVMRVNVRTPLEAIDVDFKVVGSFDLFPSWMPEEGPLIVGNLDFLFESLGWEIPYDVWVKTAEKVTDYDRIIEDIEAQGNMVMSSDIAPQKIVAEQTRPERQGLFGILSVGFIASAFLTILGFLLYALFSFRRRFIELGILRATGLTAKQMSVFLAWELAFLILAGGVVGTLLGGLVSQLFIPYLQIGGDVASVVPPFVVEIAWSAIFRIYILFALVFLVALAGLAVLLTRMKIFQAIKLGETA
jgi:putative ABC transport system permease protein